MKQRHRMLVVLIAAGLAGALLVAAGSIALIRSAVRERFVERARAETALLAGWTDGIDAEGAQLFALQLDEAVRVIHYLGIVMQLLSFERTRANRPRRILDCSVHDMPREGLRDV